MSCLLARRMIERGVRFVTVNMFETVFNEITWDIHGSAPFSPIPTALSVALGSFKSMSGIDTELAIVDPTIPGRRCTLRGRVTSATASPGTAAPAKPRSETISFACEEIK